MKLTTEELTRIARDFRAGTKQADAALAKFDATENGGRESFMATSFREGNKRIMTLFHERVAPDYFDTPNPEGEPREELKSQLAPLQADLLAYAKDLNEAHREIKLAQAKGEEEAAKRLLPKVKELEAARAKCDRAMWFNIACGLAMLAISIWRLCA